MAATIKRYPLKTDFSDQSLTNVGSVALDEITSDSATSVTVTLGGDAGDDFIVGPSNKFVVEGESGGNVGIGTATPAATLDVLHASDPQIRLTQATGFTAAHVELEATDGGQLNIASTSFGSAMGTLRLNNNDVKFDNAGNASVSVTDTAHNAAGKPLALGAGKPTSGTTADIAGGALTLAGGQSKGSGLGGDVIVQTSAAAVSGTGLNNLVTKMIVKEDGKVGIGTAGPDRTLDVLHASDPQLRLTQADGSVFTDLQTDSNGGIIVSTTGQNSVLKSDTARVDLVLQNSSAIGTPGSNNGLRITQNGDTATFMNHGDDQGGGDMIFSIAGSAAMTLSKVGGDRNMVTTGEMTMGDDPAADAHIINGTVAINNTATLAEAKSLSLAAPLLPTTDHTATGVTAEMLAGEAITAFNLVCISAAVAGEVLHTDANAAATMPAIGIAVEGISDAATGTILLQGFIRDDTWAWTQGAVLYASGTIGGMTETAPAVSGDTVQAVGIALSDDVVYFNPSLTLVTVA